MRHDCWTSVPDRKAVIGFQSREKRVKTGLAITTSQHAELLLPNHFKRLFDQGIKSLVGLPERLLGGRCRISLVIRIEGGDYCASVLRIEYHKAPERSLMARHIQPGRLGGIDAARVVKKLAERAGLDAAKFAGHSLRAGHATSAAIAGASERSIPN